MKTRRQAGAQIEKLRAIIFALAPSTDVKFIDCLKLASPELRAQWEDASYDYQWANR